MADKDMVALELIKARIHQLTKKLEGLADKAYETKDRFEGLSELIEELEEAGVKGKELEKLRKRAKERYDENQDAVRQFNNTKNKIEELQELVSILEGEAESEG